MKKHYYTSTEVKESRLWLGNKYWRYDVTACGLRRQENDFHSDAAKTADDVTCLKCKAKLGLST